MPEVWPSHEAPTLHAPREGGGARAVSGVLPTSTSERELMTSLARFIKIAAADHTARPSPPLQRAVSAEYGRYVAQLCVGCHGPQWRGGPIANGPPGWPPAAALAGRGSVLARYANVDQFKTLLRTRTRPDGTLADPVMPLNEHLDDADVEALFLFFKSTLDEPSSPSKDR